MPRHLIVSYPGITPETRNRLRSQLGELASGFDKYQENILSHINEEHIWRPYVQGVIVNDNNQIVILLNPGISHYTETEHYI